MPRFDTVLFDLDGTITDPGIGITNSIAHAMRRFGLEPWPREQLYVFIGPPLITAFSERFGVSHDDAVLMLEYYREYFGDRGLFENTVYPGVAEMLATLKDGGVKVALATSKPEPFARQILERFDLMKYFDVVAGATMDSNRICKADVIRYALESCDICACYKVVT